MEKPPHELRGDGTVSGDRAAVTWLFFQSLREFTRRKWVARAKVI